MDTEPEPTSAVGVLFHRITDDLKVIARDELELAKTDLKGSIRTASIESAAMVLGGVVALIGFAMLCATAVAALGNVIPALWPRLLIMALIYLGLGGAIAGIFMKRVKEDAPPHMNVAGSEAKRTFSGIKDTLSNNYGGPHA